MDDFSANTLLKETLGWIKFRRIKLEIKTSL